MPRDTQLVGLTTVCRWHTKLWRPFSLNEYLNTQKGLCTRLNIYATRFWKKCTYMYFATDAKCELVSAIYSHLHIHISHSHSLKTGRRQVEVLYIYYILVLFKACRRLPRLLWAAACRHRHEILVLRLSHTNRGQITGHHFNSSFRQFASAHLGDFQQTNSSGPSL